jgi:hypothetical protein
MFSSLLAAGDEDDERDDPEDDQRPDQQVEQFHQSS